MDPITAIVGGVVLIVLAVTAPACSDESAHAEEDVDAEGVDAFADFFKFDTGDVSGEVDEGVVEDKGGVKDTPGINRHFLKTGCDIADIDVYGKKLFGVCAKPIPGDNYEKFFQVDIGDSSKPHNAKMAPAVAGQMYLDDPSTPYTLFPEQIMRSGLGTSDDNYLVIYSGTGPGCLSGISAVSADDYTMSYFSGFSFGGTDQLDPETWQPCDMKSALIANGNEVWAPFTVSSGGNSIGILRGCELLSNEKFEIEEGGCNSHPAFLNGLNPSAISDVSGIYGNGNGNGDYDVAAVLNSKGYGNKKPVACEPGKIKEFGCQNASIDIFKLAPPIAEGYEKPVAMIDLGVGEVVPLNEMPKTADGKYAVVVAEDKVIIVDLAMAKVAGVADDGYIGVDTVKDVAVRNYRAYVTTKDSIYIYNFEDPANPEREDAIQILPGKVRSIAIDDNGIIYVTMPDDDDVSLGNTRVFAIDPSKL